MKLLILDRDGVINHDSDDFIKTPEEWRPIKGSLEAIARLSQAGYDLVIITNQSGIGRGLFSADTLGSIHVRMVDYIHQHGGRIHGLLVCPHHPKDDCECRKPKDGLYNELAQRLSITFKDVYSVGDSMRDLQAANAAGATPILVKTGKGKNTAKTIKASGDSPFSTVAIYDNLSSFADALLANQVAS